MLYLGVFVEKYQKSAILVTGNRKWVAWMNEYFDLSTQIKHLVIDKSVTLSLEELDTVEKVLCDNSCHYFEKNAIIQIIS